MEDMATCWKVDYFEGGKKDDERGRRHDTPTLLPVR